MLPDPRPVRRRSRKASDVRPQRVQWSIPGFPVRGSVSAAPEQLRGRTIQAPVRRVGAGMIRSPGPGSPERPPVQAQCPPRKPRTLRLIRCRAARVGQGRDRSRPDPILGRNPLRNLDLIQIYGRPFEDWLRFLRHPDRVSGSPGGENFQFPSIRYLYPMFHDGRDATDSKEWRPV